MHQTRRNRRTLLATKAIKRRQNFLQISDFHILHTWMDINGCLEGIESCISDSWHVWTVVMKEYMECVINGLRTCKKKKLRYGPLRWTRVQRWTNLRFARSHFSRLSVSGHSVTDTCAWRKDKPQINILSKNTGRNSRQRSCNCNVYRRRYAHATQALSLLSFFG